jgi:hypothetical protein
MVMVPQTSERPAIRVNRGQPTLNRIGSPLDRFGPPLRFLQPCLAFFWRRPGVTRRLFARLERSQNASE